MKETPQVMKVTLLICRASRLETINYVLFNKMKWCHNCHPKLNICQINELLVDYDMYVHNSHITCLDDEADSDGAQRFCHSSTQ